MKNLGNLMKQAQQMQAKMAEMQEKMDAMEISGQAGGGMVTVTLTGKGDMRAIKIEPKLLDPDDPDMLEDLIVAAHNDAKAKVETTMQEQMGEVTGGLNLPPGIKMPF